MKLRTETTSLKKAINTVRAAASSSALSIMECVVLTAIDGHLALRAANAEYGIKCLVDAEVEREGSVAVSAQKLYEFFAALKCMSVELESDKKKLYARTTSSNAAMSWMSPDDFPREMAVDAPLLSISISTDALGLAMKRALLATSGIVNEVYSGVGVLIDDGKFISLGTDRFKTVICSTPVKGNGSADIISLPPSSARAITKMEGEKTVIKADDRTARIDSGKAVITSQLLDGKYADIRRIVSESANTTARISTKELLRVCKIAAVYAAEFSDVAVMNVGTDTIEVKSVDTEAGTSGAIATARVNGGEQSVSFNVKYLLPVLATISTNEVVVKIVSPKSPVEVNDGAGFLFCFAPINVVGPGGRK